MTGSDRRLFVTGRTKVLVVDDEPSIRLTLKALLENIGYGVVEAVDGQDGLNVFHQERPDLVLTDLRMPVMDGLTMVERLRQDAPETPIVVFSGVGAVPDAVDSLRLGAWDYVTKPVSDIERFRIIIERTLERARLLRENRLYKEHLEELVQERTTALRQSEARYRLLLDSVTSYVYTVFLKHGMPDATFHGPGCEAVTGFTPEQYASNPYLWYDMVHPDDRAAVLDGAARILAESIPVALEHRIYHKSGSVRWVENTLVPRRTAGGELVSYDGIITDITERKVAEEALRRAEEKYRHIFENAVEGVFQCTPAGVYTTVNPALAQLYGYDSADRMIAGARSIADHLDRPDEIRRKLEENGEIRGVEVNVPRQTGDSVWASLSARAVRNASGSVLYYEGTLVDISQRIEVENQRRRLAQFEDERKTVALETLRQLMVTLSHYFLNANAIIGGMTRRCGRVKSETERTSALKAIEEQSRRIEAVLGALRKIREIRTTDYAQECHTLMIDITREIDETLSDVVETGAPAPDYKDGVPEGEP